MVSLIWKGRKKKKRRINKNNLRASIFHHVENSLIGNVDWYFTYLMKNYEINIYFDIFLVFFLRFFIFFFFNPNMYNFLHEADIFIRWCPRQPMTNRTSYILHIYDNSKIFFYFCPSLDENYSLISITSRLHYP